MFDLDFYQGKKVFITGHTGFVGAWMCQTLKLMNAHVSGFAMQPKDEPNLFSLCNVERNMDSTIGDIRDFLSLKQALRALNPDIIIHLAAQPLVREGYQAPLYTYETNVIGTANLLECVRQSDRPAISVLNVTTDKVYQNNELSIGFCESDPLDGFDPYSNSKSCSELITHCYKNSYFEQMGVAVSTARAGNIIGGGDFSKDRILPDCVDAALNNQPIVVRNPHSIRPYQHVLESVFAYLLIAQKQYKNIELADCYNIGPNEKDCQNTGEMVSLFCKHWGSGITWETRIDPHAPHEASHLKLNCAKIKQTLGWKPSWEIETAVAKTVEWSKAYAAGKDVCKLTDEQINEFIDQL